MLGFSFVWFFPYPASWLVWPGCFSSGLLCFVSFCPCYVFFPPGLVCWGGFNFCSGWPLQAVFSDGWEVLWLVFAGLVINDIILLVNYSNHSLHYIFNSMWWVFWDCNLNEVNGYFFPCPFYGSLGLDTTGILFDPLYSFLLFCWLVCWLDFSGHYAIYFFLGADLGVLYGCVGVLYCLLKGCYMDQNFNYLFLCHSCGYSSFLLGKLTFWPVYSISVLLVGNTGILEVFGSQSTTLLYYAYLISHPFLEFWFFAGSYTKLAVMSSLLLISLSFFSLLFLGAYSYAL